jgi:large subunit ribosomal protein L19
MGTVSEIEKAYMKKKIARFDVGDTVDVRVKIKEGDSERIQVFAGTVIARRGSGTRETFTVRRIVAGEGVERVFPLHSPVIAGIKVTRRGSVRRAKLYYLRERVGKATKVKEFIEEVKEKKPRVKKRGRKARKAMTAAADAKAAESASPEEAVEEEVAAEE